MGPTSTLTWVVSSEGGYGYAEDDSIDYATIDLHNYAYAVLDTISADPAPVFRILLRLVSFRIDYAYPDYVPLAMKDHSGQ
jgi:hypothetical protein